MVAPAAEVALVAADDVVPRSEEDMLALALDTAEEIDSEAELAAELTEETAELTEEAASETELDAEPMALVAESEAFAVTPVEKMVMEPTVLVMVLPSVVMVERISEVVIAPTCSNQHMTRFRRVRFRTYNQCSISGGFCDGRTRFSPGGVASSLSRVADRARLRDRRSSSTRAGEGTGSW